MINIPFKPEKYRELALVWVSTFQRVCERLESKIKPTLVRDKELDSYDDEKEQRIALGQ